jgi:transposase
MLSNDIFDPKEALYVYRTKDKVEKAFDNLKNELDLKRLRIH